MNIYRTDGKHLNFVGTGVELPGQLKQVAGVAGIIDPTPDSQAVPNGALHSVTARGTVLLDNSGVVFADGDLVNYDATANNAVASPGGDFTAGRCVGGATASQQVEVLLNGTPAV